MPELKLIEAPVEFTANPLINAPVSQIPADELCLTSEFSLAFNRLQEAAGVRTMQALAELFRVRMAFVSDMKRRQKLPATWLYHLLLTRRVSPQWILFGTGPKELALADLVDESVTSLLLQTATE